MLIAFTGGGTAGHIYPNIAVIEELKSKAQVIYVGGKNSLEKEIAFKEKIDFFGVSAGKFRRYWDLRNFTDVFRILSGIAESYKILRKKKPELLFSKGGFVSVPVVIAARLLDIPVWIHESDLSPGLATKICSRFAKKIFVSFEETKRHFGSAKKIKTVGNPIRKNIAAKNKPEAMDFFGFSEKLPVTLVIGGSSGARSLNELIYKILPDLLEKTQIIHVTGANPQSFNPAGYKQFDFLEKEELAYAYAASDLVISRAGSGSIFEILAAGKRMLLVPLPLTASRGDQLENARFAEKHGWASFIEQEKISPREFLEKIIGMLKEKKPPKTEKRLLNAARIIAEEMIKITAKP